jgi:hypothetical protein
LGDRRDLKMIELDLFDMKEEQLIDLLIESSKEEIERSNADKPKYYPAIEDIKRCLLEKIRTYGECDIDSKKCGIKISYKDGRYDWFDPIYKDDKIEYESEYRIDNGCNVYSIPKKDVDKIEYFDICKICGFEIEKEDKGICRHCHPDEYDKVHPYISSCDFGQNLPRLIFNYKNKK